jgi:hypothetical protein
MVYLAPLLAVAMIVLRNARARRLRVERLWVAPLALLILIGLALAREAPPGPAMLAVDLAALALGAVAGWWRGRLTRITVDPATHALTSRTSPVGMLLILALFVLRSGIRAMGAQTAGALHIPARGLADALLLVTVGLVCAQRLEIALRATRMLREARGKG